MEKFLYLTSQLDLYKAPVKINIPNDANPRGKSGRKKNHSNKRGSFFGFLLSAISIIFTFSLFMSMVTKMFLFQLDVS